MAAAAKHKFRTQDAIQRFLEQTRFYQELRGHDYDPARPIPKTTVSDCRQVAKDWDKSFYANLLRMQKRSESWEKVGVRWLAAVKRLKKTQLGVNDTYDDNPGFWKAVYGLAAEISSLKHALSPSEVLVWSVKETAKEHAQAVVDAGRAAADAAGAAAGVIAAIPTVAKALAVGAVGLGVFAVARRGQK